MPRQVVRKFIMSHDFEMSSKLYIILALFFHHNIKRRMRLILEMLCKVAHNRRSLVYVIIINRVFTSASNEETVKVKEEKADGTTI